MGPSRNQGFGMIGALVSTGLVGIIAVGAAQVFKSQYYSQSITETELSKIAIENYIFNGIDCQASRLALSSPCSASNTPVEIRSRLDSSVVLVKKFNAELFQPWNLGEANVTANDMTTVGKYYIAATCDANGSLSFFVKKVKGIPKKFIRLTPRSPWRCALQ